MSTENFDSIRELPSVDGYKITVESRIEPAVRGKHLGIATVKITADNGNEKQLMTTEKRSNLSFYNSITEEYFENLWRTMALKIYSRASKRFR